MKKINLLYIVIIPALFGIWHISQNYGQHSAIFYGFAENKDTEINHDHPVHVNKILVAPGEFVNKGDLLIEAEHAKFDLKLNDLKSDIEAAKLRVEERKTNLLSNIRQLELSKELKRKEIQLEIEEIKSEIALNESLLKEVESIKVETNKNQLSPKEQKIKMLEEELALSLQPIDQEIKFLKKELSIVNSPLEVQMEKLEKEQIFYSEEQKKLSITAPTDGLIGNIHCKEGEHKSSFATLITFYERNPTMVSGYVHENLILHVKEGDTLEVSSSLHPEHKKLGVVKGLGSRIVEIPERLRKIPEMKTYGREVLISIPPDNPFLQKEKVVLNFIHPENIPSPSIFDYFQTQNSSNSKREQEAINLK